MFVLLEEVEAYIDIDSSESALKTIGTAFRRLLRTFCLVIYFCRGRVRQETAASNGGRERRISEKPSVGCSNSQKGESGVPS